MNVGKQREAQGDVLEVLRLSIAAADAAVDCDKMNELNLFQVSSACGVYT